MRTHFPRTLLGLLIGAACAGAAAQTPQPLADYSLEQLSEIVVTSVARQATSLASAPVSIQRISAQQIRRSGATTLPEALRMASALHVARTAAGNYVITARGFSSTLENKMLVMIDGRSVYSPLFSGVFWDVQDVLLEDVDRIEVISGPGSTIWGANAVNGVINVITRSARDTQGAYASVAAGSSERMGAARYGAALGDGGSYRIYAKYGEHDDLENEAGEAVRGRWHRTQAGFRTDFNAGDFQATVSGDAYTGRRGNRLDPDLNLSGSNLGARLQRTLADGSGLRLQAWFDHVERGEPTSASEKLDTADLEVQHDLKLAGRHNISWGGGYRHARDRVRNAGTLEFAPARASLHWANLFAQDQMLLTPDLQLTLGTRFEKTTYTGVEWLPMARLAYHAGGDDLLWLAATRTVRAPSRIDRDLSVRNAQPDGVPRYTIEANTDFRSELARVLELGYRSARGPRFTYVVVGYHAWYDDLRTLEPRAGRGAVFANMGEGRTYGLEVRGRWQVTPHWALNGGGIVQHAEFWRKPGSLASLANGLAANDPRSYWRLHSAHELGHGIELDLELRRVARLPQPAVPSYHELDVRLAWNAAPGLEASITGRNLLHSEHPEFGPAATRQLVGRSVLFNLSWRH
ncbi:MAG TPA: TonB-dependent receptor [Telluria sp.]|nr:TonB-dependent receptor [Telluria sp.]